MMAALEKPSGSQSMHGLPDETPASSRREGRNGLLSTQRVTLSGGINAHENKLSLRFRAPAHRAARLGQSAGSSLLRPLALPCSPDKANAKFTSFPGGFHPAWPLLGMPTPAPGRSARPLGLGRLLTRTTYRLTVWGPFLCASEKNPKPKFPSLALTRIFNLKYCFQSTVSMARRKRYPHSPFKGIIREPLSPGKQHNTWGPS